MPLASHSGHRIGRPADAGHAVRRAVWRNDPKPASNQCHHATHPYQNTTVLADIGM